MMAKLIPTNCLPNVAMASYFQDVLRTLNNGAMRPSVPMSLPVKHTLPPPSTPLPLGHNLYHRFSLSYLSPLLLSSPSILTCVACVPGVSRVTETVGRSSLSQLTVAMLAEQH